MGFLEWFLKPVRENTPEKKSADIRTQALANMRAARDRIGEGEIQKMAESLRGEALKAGAQRARKDIIAADKERVAGHVRTLLKDE